jgi:hypothetical protein
MDFIVTDLRIYQAAGRKWPGAAVRSVTLGTDKGPVDDSDLPDIRAPRPTCGGTYFGGLEIIANLRFRPILIAIHSLQAQMEFLPMEYRARVNLIEDEVMGPGFSAGINYVEGKNEDGEWDTSPVDDVDLTNAARQYFLREVDRLRGDAETLDQRIRHSDTMPEIVGKAGSLSRLLMEHVAVDYRHHVVRDNNAGEKVAVVDETLSKGNRVPKFPVLFARFVKQIARPHAPQPDNLLVNTARSVALKRQYGPTDDNERLYLAAAVETVAAAGGIGVAPVPATSNRAKGSISRHVKEIRSPRAVA